MKTVLILVNHDVVIYNFRRELVEELIRRGYRVIVSSPQGERISKLIDIGCEYEEVVIKRHGKNPIDELKLYRYYKGLIRRVNPDIVLTYTIKPNIYGGFAAKRNKVPYVANITGLGTAVEKKGIMQNVTVFLYKLAFSHIQQVFFQNMENMSFFKEKGIVPNKHKLLPGSGVNLEQFGVLEYPSDETIEFVFISRIMKEKGIDLFIDVAKEITKEYTNCKFHVCGFCEEDYKDRLSELEIKGVLTYHGMVSDVREILQLTHCTVHPTYYPEGLSNVLLESASSARPIITTDRSGCREVVDEFKNGFLVKLNDYDDLLDKVTMFIQMNYDDKKQMGLAGRRLVEDRFDRKIVVEAYITEIEQI